MWGVWPMARSGFNNRQRAAKPTTAPSAYNGLQRWTQLTSIRRGMIDRFEGYASCTIPKVCLPDGVDQNSQRIQHDWSSVGAQAVNHLTNKLVLALFQPGIPFFRLDPNPKLAKQLAGQGVTDDILRAGLVKGEQEALRILDQKALRPKLNEVCRNLIVTGNMLLDMLDKDNPRVYGIKNYAVKRSISGAAQEILIREKVLWDELEDEVRAVVKQKTGPAAYCEHVRWYQKVHTKWKLTVSVDGVTLGEDFSQEWTEATFALYPVVWDLADEHDYGTGLVEDYAGDFSLLSTLSESEIKAAILASDYRWLSNPSGSTDVGLFKTSETGDVIPGVSGDLSLVAHVGAGNLQAIGLSLDRVINRIGRGFLLGSAATRQAERVTAEEIRMQANELETSLGGVYSRLAIDLQLPIARWLLIMNGTDIAGTDMVPTIVTGFAALSRNAEAQQLGLFLQAVSGLGQTPPEIGGRLKLSSVIATMASAYGISAPDYVYTEEEYQQMQAQAQQAQQEADAQQVAVEAGAQAAAKQGQE